MAVLGLGSNCGDRLQYLQKAIRKLKSPIVSPRIKILAQSPIYESDALLPEGAPEDWNREFLNVNLLCETDLFPIELLQHIKSIERDLGRQARGRWAPREIDIDILAMDSQVVEEDDLKVPHLSLLERPFAMLPFADLLPQWRYPKSGPQLNKTASEIVFEWKKKRMNNMPFQTRRSDLCLTQLVGILNITPDSFSDGGLFNSEEAALNRANEFVSQGVRVLDIGAESTRPGAIEVPPQEEWKRLEPILKGLQSLRKQTLISLDTRHPEVAEKAIQTGIDWINDVSGLENPRMQKIAAQSGLDVVVMHSMTVPPKAGSVLSSEEDPTSLILDWAENRFNELNKNGISHDRIIFDPGFGFGKTRQQSWELLREMRRFHDLGVRILVGHSRKTFLTMGSSLAKLPASSRDVETLALTQDLAEKGIDYLRVHDPESNTRALRVWAQVNGISQCRL